MIGDGSCRALCNDSSARDDHSKNSATATASLCLLLPVVLDIRTPTPNPSPKSTPSPVHHFPCSLHHLSLLCNPLRRVYRPINPFISVKMLRTGAVKALQAITRTQVPRQLPAFRSQITSSYLQSSQITPAFAISSIRCYSASAGLTKPEVQGRIMDLLKNFDKVRY